MKIFFQSIILGFACFPLKFWVEALLISACVSVLIHPKTFRETNAKHPKQRFFWQQSKKVLRDIIRTFKLWSWSSHGLGQRKVNQTGQNGVWEAILTIQKCIFSGSHNQDHFDFGMGVICPKGVKEEVKWAWSQGRKLKGRRGIKGNSFAENNQLVNPGYPFLCPRVRHLNHPQHRPPLLHRPKPK